MYRISHFCASGILAAAEDQEFVGHRAALVRTPASVAGLEAAGVGRQVENALAPPALCSRATQPAVSVLGIAFLAATWRGWMAQRGRQWG